MISRPILGLAGVVSRRKTHSVPCGATKREALVYLRFILPYKSIDNLTSSEGKYYET